MAVAEPLTEARTITYAQAGKYKVDVKIFAHVIGAPTPPATSPVASFSSVLIIKPKS